MYPKATISTTSARWYRIPDTGKNAKECVRTKHSHAKLFNGFMYEDCTGNRNENNKMCIG